MAREAIELAVATVAEQFDQLEIELSLKIDSLGGVSVVGDRVLFEQALINLLTNARHAFGSLEGRARGLVQAEVRIEASKSVSNIRIQICDNAGGLRQEVLDHVFRAFVTTKSPEAGIGLGLTLTRKIIVDISGSITAANVDGGGSSRSKFHFVKQRRASLPSREI